MAVLKVFFKYCRAELNQHREKILADKMSTDHISAVFLSIFTPSFSIRECKVIRFRK